MTYMKFGAGAYWPCRIVETLDVPYYLNKGFVWASWGSYCMLLHQPGGGMVDWRGQVLRDDGS